MNLKNQDLLRTKAFISDKWVEADDGKVMEVLNPFDFSVVATVPDMSVVDVQWAIDAAFEAGKKWKLELAEVRANLLKKLHGLLLLHQSDLAELLMCEQGKPLAEAMGEIAYGASYLEWFAEEARRVYGDVIPAQSGDKRIMTLKQPVGVVGIITPWNFPNAMIARKLGAALAAGCTVVIKPSELTPLSALAISYLAQLAGFPSGVINVVTCRDAAAVGEELCGNELVRKISFTGSTQVGRLLMRQCADSVKKLSLELGGNAPFIVFDDADVDAAVAGAVASKFRNAGQTCVCSNRFYVQAGIYDRFVAKFAEAILRLKVGNGAETGTDIGPLISAKARQRVQGFLQDALLKGAQLVCGGEWLAGTNAMTPALLCEATDEMWLAHDEVFGPLAPVFKFETEEEVVRRANATEYGLAAYFYGQQIHQIWRVAEALEFGMVGINTGLISSAVAPFGGIKQSGVGREGSKYGLDDYLEIKYLCFGGMG